MTERIPELTPEQRSPIGRFIGVCLNNRLVVFLLLIFIVLCGIYVAPFDWNLGGLPRNPVGTDAIPDIGENQQIVFTEWMGRSPQDVEDQVTYPLTVSLLGIPGIKTIRSNSMFGFSSIFVIFDDDIEFYWSRSRILEKLNSLPSGTLPEGVQPALGPDATALGQIFWYTLEGRDPDGEPAGGWDLEELRTIQDWYVRYSLLSAGGVSEVASVGGFVKEYQVDVNPDAMRAYRVTLPEVFAAVRGSNIDVGAKTIEINRAEYFIRGIGFIKRISDLEDSVIKVNENVPVLVRHVANVTLGPELRRGAIDKSGAEAVGGVVVARFRENPLAVIRNVTHKIEEIAPGLPAKAIIDYSHVSPEQLRTYAEANGFTAYADAALNQQGWLDHLRSTSRSEWPDWANISQVAVVPFYDRTGLIYETLGTLNEAITHEILITIVVIIIMIMHLRSSAFIGVEIPVVILMTFVVMKMFGVDANILALSGIAVAIGTVVDMDIVMCETILRHLDEAPPDEPRLQVVHRAASEVGAAVLTAVITTMAAFLPVFTMVGPEAKLFKPLAFTNIFTLLSSITITLTILPSAALVLFSYRFTSRTLRRGFYALVSLVGAVLLIYGLRERSSLILFAALVIIAFGTYNFVQHRLPSIINRSVPWFSNVLVLLFVGFLLTRLWEPLGPQVGLVRNLIFVGLIVGALLGFFRLFRRFYPQILGWCLDHKRIFLSLIVLIVLAGPVVWLGFGRTFSWIPAGAETMGIDRQTVRSTSFWMHAEQKFPGLGREFMPPLDEGSFLFMPTTMPHASIGEALDVLRMQDMAFNAIPEVENAVGKIGRAESPLDPAPVSMIETVINYKSEYIIDTSGRRLTFKFDKANNTFIRDENGDLIADPKGLPYRKWRDHIRSPNDIWTEIVKAADIPGTTSAPKLQPIAARIVMLQSGMRAPMGVKIKGPSLEAIENTGLAIERFLKTVPGVMADAVFADRIVGKPYLEIIPDRQALARYGIAIRDFQDVVEVAIGGAQVTTTVEGRERFPVRVRYERELRDQIETIRRILVPGAAEVQIPLEQVARIEYVAGPQEIKSEDTFLVGYVLFDKLDGHAEVDVVENARAYLNEKIRTGELVIPPGVNYTFAGNYENQVRAQKTLAVVLPLSLFIIFIVLYLKFKSTMTSLLVFTGIIVAWSGGFILIWLYGQDWFLDFAVFGVNMRDLFQVHTINLSVAIWVGFLVLFGIASDDGVVMATYLEQSFRGNPHDTPAKIREATIAAGKRRIRPCLMTTATTLLALLPILTSTGRGSDIMVPMAIPSFGGMTIEILTMLVVPVLYCLIQERRLKARLQRNAAGPANAPAAADV
ncbi:MAG: efflux RND transporter permease subunit [Phycisphaerae bacterium]|nr:efflux RND transporter permease subunit [Phycisphaerae bacterium]